MVNGHNVLEFAVGQATGIGPPTGVSVASPISQF